jgi:hypothetical protein
MGAPPEKRGRPPGQVAISKTAPKSQLIRYAQATLDAAEDFAARRKWIGTTFRILQLKRALGLRYRR